MVRDSSGPTPAFALRADRLEIVVEGVGEVTEKYYEPAFRAVRGQCEREIHVTFADDSSFWEGKPDFTAKMERRIASVRSWTHYLNKAKDEDRQFYQNDLTPDVVIIATPAATHADIAREWIGRNPRPEQIFIEKPLDTSLKSIRRLLGMLAPYDEAVLAFDHYRARFLPSQRQRDDIISFLGEGLTRFTFYFLEDHSGADPTYRPTVRQRDGAFENEQRVESLKDGYIFDAAPHALALLDRFGRLETFRVTRVRAGRYVGVDGIPERPSEMERETFAEIGGVCKDHAGNRVECTIDVGKGVRGVEVLGTEFDYNVKLVELEGLNARRCRIDLRSTGAGASRCYLINEVGKIEWECSINPDPYGTFLSKVVDGTYRADQLALYVEGGKRIAEVLEDMTEPIRELALPIYPSGLASGRASLYLEKILAHVPIVYGR